MSWLHERKTVQNYTRLQQNGIAERFMRTLKEEHVDYSEYEGFDDAQHWVISHQRSSSWR